MKISVSSYSYRQYIKDGKMTQFDCVAKAKEMGFDAIEFIDIEGETLEERKENAKKIREEADRLGIEINAYTVSANLYKETEEESDAEVERLKGQLDIAKILGAKVLRHDLCWELKKTGNAKSFDLMLPELAERARRIADYGEKLGIKTCSENHGRIAQDSERMERTFNAVNHDNYGLLVDMGNFMSIGEDPAMAVSRLAPYAVHVHVKDVKSRTEEFEGYRYISRNGRFNVATVIGTGDVPIEQCLRVLISSGYDGFLTVEYEAPDDCIEGIAKGKANLEAMLERAEACFEK